MEKLKLNKEVGNFVESHGYVLDATKEYIIDLNDEMDEQNCFIATMQIMGLPALNDYHNWLTDNEFNAYKPNPTNAFVSKYYGVKPLWCTNLSQGIVVKSENDDDYYIVMECSRLNEGFKYAQIIVTLGGCY